MKSDTSKKINGAPEESAIKNNLNLGASMVCLTEEVNRKREKRIQKLKKGSGLPFTGLLNSTIDYIGDDPIGWFLIRLLRLPEDWEIHPESLSKELGMTRKKFSRYFTRLVELRLAERKEIRGDDGKFLEYQYFVYQEPLEEEPVDKKALAAKRPLTNKEKKTKKDLLPATAVITPGRNTAVSNGTPEGSPSPDHKVESKNVLEDGSRDKPQKIVSIDEVEKIKDPLKKLTVKQRRFVYALLKEHLMPGHENYLKVRFKRGTAANYVARGVIAGLKDRDIVGCYLTALSESHTDGIDFNQERDNASVVTRAWRALLNTNEYIYEGIPH